MGRYQMKRVLAGFLCAILIFSAPANLAYGMEASGENTDLLAQEGEVITGSIINMDFSNYSFAASTAARKTLDNALLGYIDVAAGAKEAELVEAENSRKVLKLNAIQSPLNSFKSGLSLKGRFGVELKVKFGDTTSQRQFFQMKGLDEGGNYSWPTLLTFAADGKVKNSAGSVIGSYQADIWYTIKLDIDTPNQRYLVSIDGGEELISSEATLNTGGGGDRIWRGVRENKAFAQSRTTGSTNWMEFAYVKAGEIVVGIEEFTYQNLEMEAGGGWVLMPSVTPEKAFTDKITYTSSDESVVKVFGNGLLARKPGNVNISVKDAYTGLEGTFSVSVTQPRHNWDYIEVPVEELNQAIWSGYRAELDYSEDQIRALFQSAFSKTPEYYRDMSDEVFIAAVKKDFSAVSNPTQLQVNLFEKLTRYLVLMNRLTNDWEYARKAALILYYQAQDYPRVLLQKNLPYTNDLFKESEMIFGGNLVFSFGYLLNLEKDGISVWESISPQGILEEEVLSVISELYLRPLADNCMDRAMKRPSGRNNIDVYGARSTAVLANVLNDPYLIRKVVMMYDDLMSSQHYYFDGMWEEGTLSYGTQTVSNVVSGILAIEKYTDPVDYEDPLNPEEYGLTQEVMGLSLNQTLLRDRWALIGKTEGLPQVMVYPNGTPIAVNDTHFEKSLEERPIQNELLKNIEMPSFGYYGLVRGNTDNAVHAGLLYQARQRGFAGSHDHANVLSMTLWGAGQELLPDVGYVTAANYVDGGQKLRFPAMRPVFHNMPWIFRKDGANEQASLEWSKPRLISYDDGKETDGWITLVEASETGPDSSQAEVNQRLLMNIGLDESHSYVFDLSRMKGGDAHELFQRGSELENMDVSMNGISTENLGAASLIETEPFAAYKSSGLVQDMVHLKNPAAGDSSSDFSFTWEGEDSGSRITTYMNGVEGSKVFLSSIPTPRRVTTKAEEDIYTAPHVTRYREAAENMVTSYGAVHEPSAAGEKEFIREVKWSSLDGDDMGTFAVITTEHFIDYIYVSSDTAERILEGITFAGRTAFVRKDVNTGEIISSYVYGEGKAGETAGAAAQELKVTDLQSAEWLIINQTEKKENAVTVEGNVQNAEEFIGKRVILKFGDQSGYGVKVRDIRNGEGSSIVTIEDFMPARISGDGVVTRFFPHDVSIPGDASLIFERSVSGGDVSDGDVSDGDVSDGDVSDGDVSKTDLQKAVDKAEGLISGEYTQDSFAALITALEQAKRVLGDVKAAQDDVDEALTVLNAAINGLVANPGEPEGPDIPGEPEAPEEPEIPVLPETPEGTDENGGHTIPEVDWGIVDSQVEGMIRDALKNMSIREKHVQEPVLNVVTGCRILVPAQIIKRLENQNVTVAFHTGRGITFSIGENIKIVKDPESVMDLSVAPEAEPIPIKLAGEKAAGAVSARQISMVYRGSFGMAVNLHLALGKENAHKYANLYIYDELKKILVYKGSYPITKSGQAMFGIQKGADYLVTVTSVLPET